MNVLYLINYAGKAGIEKYVENLSRLGPPAGVTPYLAYSVPGPLSEKLAAAGVPSLRVSLEWKNALDAARRLAAYCRENGIEVIHAQCPRENIIALLAKRHLPELRVVFTDHFTRSVGFAWKLLYRFFTPRNHCCIAVCREGRRVLTENGCDPKKITVIYNGIEPGPAPERSDKLRRELGLSEDCFPILCLARYDPEKGLDFLVRSMKRLREKTDRPFCCAIAGDGPLMEEIRAEIVDAGLEREVRMLGYRRDVPELLGSAELYVCSSKCNEAMSFAILEAMDAGLPLVVTDVGGNRDLAETDLECGTVVPYGDEEAFADAVYRLMEDGELRRRWSAAAREKAETVFNLDQLALDVFRTYR